MSLQVIKVESDWDCIPFFLPLQENLDKEEVVTFEELKQKWESTSWGFHAKVSVELCELCTPQEAEEKKHQLEMFPEFPKTEPEIVDELPNTKELVECEEFEVICYKDLAYVRDMHNTPYCSSHKEYFSSSFAYDCKAGQVYSKDFQWIDCPCCQRTICEQNPSNGWNMQFRYLNNADEEEDYDADDYVCSKCYEEITIRDGIDVEKVVEEKKISGSWFTDFELQDAGYDRVEGLQEMVIGSGRFCYQDPEKFFSAFKAKKEAGEFDKHTVLVQFDSRAIGGLGGSVSVWKRPKKYYRVYDRQRSIYFATGYNAESMEELIKSFQSYILGASEIEFEFEEGTPAYEDELKSILGTWELIAEHLQGVDLEERDSKFSEADNWE